MQLAIHPTVRTSIPLQLGYQGAEQRAASNKQRRLGRGAGRADDVKGPLRAWVAAKRVQPEPEAAWEAEW